MTRQEHLLIILAEECSEVIKEVSKALRFGLNDKEPGQSYTNAERITLELSELRGVQELCEREGLIDLGMLYDCEEKKKRVEEYMKVSFNCGTLDKE